MKKINTIAVLLVFGVIFLVNVRTIELGDFWWHISTGKWIVQNHAIPASDPFSFTVDVPSDTKMPILRSYWIAQVLIYTVFSAGGFNTLVIFTAIFFTSLFALLYMILRRKYGLSVWASLSLVLLVVPAMASYHEVRPQVASFLFSLLVFWFIETMRQHRERAPRAVFLLPLVMLLWSNMHGGYIIGLGMILIFLGFEAFRDIRKGFRGVSPRPYIVAGLAVAACILNPGGLSLLMDLDIPAMLMRSGESNAQVFSTIQEYLPPLKYYALVGNKRYFITLWALMGLMGISFAVSFRRLDTFHLVLGAIFTFAALSAFRFGGFFFFFSIAIAGRNFALFLNDRKAVENRAVFLVPAFLAVAVLVVQIPFVQMGYAKRFLPTQAVEFVKRAKPPAELLGMYEWGGYLMWELYPEYRTFIDGRVLSEEVYRDYRDIKKADARTGELLEKYNVNTVMTYTLNPFVTGILPITIYMLKSPDWQPAYSGLDTLVFVRSDMVRDPVSKESVWNSLISITRTWSLNEPGNADVHSLLGEIYYYKGENTLARGSFRQALALDPRNPRALHYMRKLGN